MSANKITSFNQSLFEPLDDPSTSQDAVKIHSKSFEEQEPINDSTGPTIRLMEEEDETSSPEVVPVTSISSQEDDSTEEVNPFKENFLYANKCNTSSFNHNQTTADIQSQPSLQETLGGMASKTSSPDEIYAKIITSILEARFLCQLRAKAVVEANQEREQITRKQAQEKLKALAKKNEQAEKWTYYNTTLSNFLKMGQLIGGSVVVAAGMTTPGIPAAAASKLTWAGGEMIVGVAAQMLAYALKQKDEPSRISAYLDGAGKALSAYGAANSLSFLPLFAKQIPKTLERVALATPELVNINKERVQSKARTTQAEAGIIRVQQEKKGMEYEDEIKRDFGEWSLRSTMDIANRLSEQAHTKAHIIAKMLTKSRV